MDARKKVTTYALSFTEYSHFVESMLRKELNIMNACSAKECFSICLAIFEHLRSSFQTIFSRLLANITSNNSSLSNELIIRTNFFFTSKYSRPKSKDV